jgi:hypothetical protein
VTLIVPIRPAPTFGTLTCSDCGKADVPKLGPTSKRCPECQAIETKRQKKANYRRTAEHQKAQRRARYQENRDQELAYRRAQRYGLDDGALLDLLAAQGGACPVCTEAITLDTLSLDHCHDTGIVRGALHADCNTALGLLRDSAANCARAADYLSRPVADGPRTHRAELLAIPSTTCTDCGRVGTRRFRQRPDGSWCCFDGTRCRRRVARQVRGDHHRGRPRTAATA